MFKESFFEGMQNQPKKPEGDFIKENPEAIEAEIKEVQTEGEKNKEKMLAEHEEYKKEMEAKENEVRPEIEAEFKNALEALHTKIQGIRNSDKEFPSRDALGELLEKIPLFARMQEGAQNMFLDVLESKKEFKSSDPQVFIAKGMKVLDLFINLAVLKKGGDLWLQERMEKRAAQSEGSSIEKLSDEKPKEVEAEDHNDDSSDTGEPS